MKIRYLVIALTFVFIFEGLLVLPETWGPGRRFLAAVLPSVVVNYANEDRSQNQAPVLTENLVLAQAAQLKAEDMAKRSYFSHEGPNGEAPWIWLEKVGYNYVYAGENLAINFYDSSDVNKAWMNSPKHRDNLLDKKFTDIGVGVAIGQFEGRDSVFIVQFFGSTEESLAKQAKTFPVVSRNHRLLGAVASLTDSLISTCRHWSLAVAEWCGYKPTKGEII